MRRGPDPPPGTRGIGVITSKELDIARQVGHRFYIVLCVRMSCLPNQLSNHLPMLASNGVGLAEAAAGVPDGALGMGGLSA